MKRLLVVVLLAALMLQAALADPYSKPYNDVQTVQTYYAPQVPTEITQTYRGERDYLLRANNYNFSDVSGQDKLNAIHMAIFDISKGVAPNQYAPNKKVSNIAILTMLVRLYGDDEALVGRVRNDYGEAPVSAYQSALNDAYYQEAKTMGILQAAEQWPYYDDASRQNIARWLFNASDLAALQQMPLAERASDWQVIEPRNRQAVDRLLDYGVMTTMAERKFNPQRSMTRLEVANMFKRLYEQTADRFAVTTEYAIVVGIDSRITEQAASAFTYTLRRSDDSYLTIELDESSSQSNGGLSIVRNGQLRTHRALQLGDEISIVRQGDVVKYAVVLPPFTVRRKLIAEMSKRSDLQIHQGNVISNLTETSQVAADQFSRQRLRLELDDDAMVDIVSDYNQTDNQLNSYPIINGNSYSLPQNIAIGSAMTFYTVGDHILYASIGKAAIQHVQGSIRRIDALSEPATIELLSYDNRIIEVPVDLHARIQVNDYQAKLTDLKIGADAALMILNGKAHSIMAYSYQAEAGYIPARGKIDFATIKAIQGNQISVQNSDRIYFVDKNSKLFRETVPIKTQDLRPGDRIKLYFDSISTNIASRIEVEGKEQLIQSLLKGKLYNYNQHTDEIEIAQRYRLRNTLWQSENTPFSVTYRMASDVAIYDGNQQITTAQLNNDYYQREAYFIIRDNFGRNEVAKIVLKDGFERHYNDVVGDYSNVLNKMELLNQVNVSYDDATIFLQDDRVVDKDSLRKKASVYVLANMVSGRQNAQIVSLLGESNDIFSTIYIGVIEQVNPYDVVIDYYTIARDYKFLDVSTRQKTVYLSDETEIYDATKQQRITREQLFNDVYSREENDNKRRGGLDYNRYYGIFITDGDDNLIALKLRFKGLLADQSIDDKVVNELGIKDELQDMVDDARFTRGIIAGFNPQWTRIELRESYNYAPYSREWQPNQHNTFIELKDAIIIKDDQMITYDDLMVGDDVYAIRADEDAFVLYVK